MARAFVLLPLTLAVAVGLTPRADAQPKQKALKIGMLQGMFKDVPPAVVQAVSVPFRDLFKKQAGVDGDVEVVDDCFVLADRMKAKDLQVGVFHGFEYAWVRDTHPELVPLVVTIPPSQVQACLVVHAASKAEKPSDLKGACVAMPIGTKAHCALFLDRLKDKLPGECCCPASTGELTPEEVLDAVVTKKCPAALVDASSLTAYEKNKPGPATQLKVLVQSVPFPPAVIAYRKDTLDPAAVSNIRSGLVGCATTSQGKAFLMLWRLKGFSDIPANFNAELDRIAKEYPPPAK